MKIGYLIPEFPGQTHIFFWREMRALQECGIVTELVSTQLPDSKIISHEWAENLRKQTVYMYPPPLRALFGALGAALRAGPRRLLRCVQMVMGAEGGFADRLKTLPLAFFGAQLAWIARTKGWRHLHVHSCGNSAHIAAFAHELSGLSFSMTLHGPLRDYGPNQKQKWRRATFAIVITRQLLEEVERTLVGNLPAVIKVAPMGVDLDRFRRTASYEPWIGDGPCRLFTCGRLNPCKGHDDLIRAVDLMVKRGTDVHLRIAGEDAGDGSHRRDLEGLITELKLEDRVELLGAVSEAAVMRELEAAHLFALASLAEPLGVVIMEAMAMQVPVVVTGTGGVPELIDDGTDGLLVPPRDPERLAAAAESVLRNPALAKRLSGAGLLKVERGFSSKRSAEIISECLNGSSEGTRAIGKE